MKAKAVGELSLAEKNFLKAIEIEESFLAPYSERIVRSNYFLQEIEKEIKSLKSTKSIKKKKVKKGKKGDRQLFSEKVACPLFLWITPSFQIRVPKLCCQ